MSGLRLRHDILDAQLVDRHDREIGRCDALMLELRPDAAPRVAAILVGGPARQERIGGWMQTVAAIFRFVFRVRRVGVSRIPFDAMREVGDCIKLDVERGQLESEHVEQWLSEQFVCRIPGSRGEKK